MSFIETGGRCKKHARHLPDRRRANGDNRFPGGWGNFLFEDVGLVGSALRTHPTGTRGLHHLGRSALHSAERTVHYEPGDRGIVWMPKTLSGHLDFRGQGPAGEDATRALLAKIERGALLPLRCVRTSDSAGPALAGRPTEPGHRSRRSSPSGPRLASTGGASGTTACRSSRSRWIEPTSVGCSPGTLRCPAGDPAAMASTIGATEMDLLAPTAWTTDDSSGHGTTRSTARMALLTNRNRSNLEGAWHRRPQT